MPGSAAKETREPSEGMGGEGQGTPQKKRLKEIFSISGGKLEDVLSCLSGLMSVSV